MGDLNRIKNHLHLGDCMNILPRIPDDSIDLVIADPPYGVAWQSHSRTHNFRAIANDKRPYIWWLQEAQRVLKPTGSMVCFTRWDVLHIFANAMQYAGFSVQSCIVWDKAYHGMGDTRRMFAPQHEMALFAIKDKAFAFPDKRPVDVIRIPRINGTQISHPAEKPVELLLRLIVSTTNAGDVVLDPFVGCGTSVIACLRSGRDYIGIEIDPEYFETASKRVQDEQKG